MGDIVNILFESPAAKRSCSWHRTGILKQLKTFR